MKIQKQIIMKIRFLEAYSLGKFAFIEGCVADVHKTKAEELIAEGIVEPCLV